MKKNFVSSVIFSLPLSSCVSSKKCRQKQAEYDKLNSFYTQAQLDLQNCRVGEQESARRQALLEKETEGLGS